MTTMPTSHGDRYAQLLQNLAVRIGAIREAIERAFGVTLPTAPTLNAALEIVANAIYAAADRPRPVPLTDDKPNTRTHFVYRIDIWTDDGKNIVEYLAGLENLIVARAAYRAACDRWPHARITLRQGSRIVEYNLRSNRQLAGYSAKHYRLPHKCQDIASAVPSYPLDWVVLG
jgi:hypothetical protein